MRVSNCLFSILGFCGLAIAQEPMDKPAPPVPFPELKHYSPLWERSIFTTRDLPSPDAPAGPIFTDSLSLSGVYEVDGVVVAVLVDRTTSLITEARMGAENDAGIKIRKITPGASMDKTRVQLQKGDQAGWVTFTEIPAVPPAAAPVPGLQTRPVVVPALSSPLLPPVQNPAPPPVQVPAGDVPLPPP